MYAKIEYEGDGTTLIYSIPFDYIEEEHISVVDSSSASNEYSFLSKSLILLTDPIPVGETLTILRDTPIDYIINYFSNVSVLKGTELDADFEQFLYAMQELQDKAVEAGQDITGFLNDINMNGFKIYNLADADLENLDEAANVNTVLKLISKYAYGGAITWNEGVCLEGQTDFVLDFDYTLGNDAIALYIAGVRQSPSHIVEVDKNTVRLTAPTEGGEEWFILVSDQPANAVKIPQATTEVIGGGKVATIPQVDDGNDNETIITPYLLEYKFSTLDFGSNIDQSLLIDTDDIVDIAQGKYYVADYSTMLNPPLFLEGRGVIIKVNKFAGSFGGIIQAWDENGNMAVKIKTGQAWGDWKNINENKVIATTSPDDNDGRPNGTIYYQLVE